MADFAIILDCEYLTLEDSSRRMWYGPYDPDPTVVQIGAVKLSLRDDFQVLDTFKTYVSPKDRTGNNVPIDPFLTKLTGITQQEIDTHGIDLTSALEVLNRFADDAEFWSWGKDELNMIAISCFVANITPPFPATRFNNASDLLLSSGMPYEELLQTRSNKLAEHFGLKHDELTAHDGLDDALSVTYALQYLLQNGRLSKSDFTKN